MTLQQMHYALTVADCGSMNKAAQELFIVQPTLTRAIRELEEEVGYPLFQRSTRGITPTREGQELLTGIRQLYQSYEAFLDRYVEREGGKKKFGVSTQHYSFAVKAFVEMVRHYDTGRFAFSLRETQTRKVIYDVGQLKSEVGILYRNSFNQKAIDKLLRENDLEFHPLILCQAFVYLWKGHPLAREASISAAQLEPYPCLSFEQGEGDDLTYAEEILGDYPFPRTITATDRATMLNLMVGLNGYTLCSGIISEDLNGDAYVVVPFREDQVNKNTTMEIGYLLKKRSIPSQMAERYIEELRRCLALELAEKAEKAESQN